MTDPIVKGSGGSSHPAYPVVLACPACTIASPQEVLRARVVLTLAVPGHPFKRAFGWAEEIDRLQLSPLNYGVCLCPRCSYPGPETDFRPEPGQTHANVRAIRRLFVDEVAGLTGPIPEVLGPSPGKLPEPERSIRLILAAIRAEMLPYPELWRKRELGRLYLQLAWLYLDESHLDWQGVRPAEPPAYWGAGPNQERLHEIFDRLGALRETWPEIPLDEDFASNEALRYHTEVYQTRVQDLSPEDTVNEERQLGELLGLVGQQDAARAMLIRSRATCLGLRLQALEKQKSLFEDMSFSLSDRRALSTRIQRLTGLATEITEQIVGIFGKQALGDSPSLIAPPGKPPVAAAARSLKPASAAKKAPAPKKPEKKRRFGFFR